MSINWVMQQGSDARLCIAMMHLPTVTRCTKDVTTERALHGGNDKMYSTYKCVWCSKLV